MLFHRVASRPSIIHARDLSFLLRQIPSGLVGFVLENQMGKEKKRTMEPEKKKKELINL